MGSGSYCDSDVKVIYREKDRLRDLYCIKDDLKELNNIPYKSTTTEQMIEKLIPKVDKRTSKSGFQNRLGFWECK